MTPKITRFTGEHRFLSNFWPAEVNLQGEAYPSVEHAYQAAKAVDSSERKQFQNVKMTAGQAKRAGRALSARKNWNAVKGVIMGGGLVAQKFCMHEDLAQRLLATGDAVLKEGNTWGDTYWGVCEGEGQNHLGRILMGVRQGIRDAEEGKSLIGLED